MKQLIYFIKTLFLVSLTWFLLICALASLYFSPLLAFNALHGGLMFYGVG